MPWNFLEGSYCFSLIHFLYLEMWFFTIFGGCLVCNLKQPFSVFKQHFTHFNALFHPHVFPQIFLNNNFQFLNTWTKRALDVLLLNFFRYYFFLLLILYLLHWPVQTLFFPLTFFHSHCTLSPSQDLLIV